MSRIVTSRKPWTCDECEQEQPKGSPKHIVRDGRWHDLPGFGRVHVDGDFSYCAACMERRRP